MPENEEISSYICDLPTEVLLHIFLCLPGRQLVRSRQVCVRWKHIIDHQLWNDCLWEARCREDFANVYKEARRQSLELHWFNIYRCLALWPKIEYAKELQDEFASASAHNDQLYNLKVLHNGIIGVHKYNSIAYYDIRTLEPYKQRTITGMYTSYTENIEAIAVQSDFGHLFIVSKTRDDRKTIYFVLNKILLENELYYYNRDREICVVKLDAEKLTSHFVVSCPEIVMSFGYTDCLNVLTYEQKIYSVHDNKLVLKSNVEGCTDLLQQLKDHNLLERVNWQIVYSWHCMWNQTLPVGPMTNIVVVKLYGEMVFVGCEWGVLRIYHKPYVAGTFDFYHSEPVKQYNFMERPIVENNCSIRQVDVLETEDGHTVLVCMPKKIAVLKYIHNFEKTASVAVLPYSDVQKMKVLNLIAA